MSDFDKFEDMELNLRAVEGLKSPAKNPVSNLNGLSGFQRWAFKNIFDTQPKKGKAYLERLGYEVNNKGEIRAEGVDMPFQTVEPDDNNPISFFTNMFGGKEGWEEMARDFADVSFDLGVSGPAIGAGTVLGTGEGTVKGATGGALAGSVVGGIPGAAVGGLGGGLLGGIAGGLLGGASGNAAAEVIKAGIGDFFLDNEVPTDMHELMYQSALAGILGKAGDAVVPMIKNWKSLKAKDLTQSLKRMAMQKSGGKFNTRLIDDFAENPQNYTEDAVANSTKELLEISNELYGTTAQKPHSTRQLTGGIAKDVIDPLNVRADLEMDKLAQNAEADFSVPNLIETMEERLKPIRGLWSRSFQERKAIKFFDNSIKGLQKTALRKGDDRLDFKEGRKFLKDMQNAAFEEGPVKGNQAALTIARDLKELANKKATDVGSDLAEINAKRSEILTTYKNTQKWLRDGDIQNAYIGRDSIAKQRTDVLLTEMDRVLGTNMKEKIKGKQFQAAVQSIYESPTAMGSGHVVKDALQGGLAQARTDALRLGSGFAAASLPFGGVSAAKMGGIGTGIGAATGFVRGAKASAQMSSPEVLVRQFEKLKTKRAPIKTRIQDIDAGRSAGPGVIIDPATGRPAGGQGRIIDPAIAGARGGAGRAGQVSAQIDQPAAQNFRDQNTDPQAGLPPLGGQNDDFSEFEDMELNLDALGVRP